MKYKLVLMIPKQNSSDLNSLKFVLCWKMKENKIESFFSELLNKFAPYSIVENFSKKSSAYHILDTQVVFIKDEQLS